MKSFLNPKTPLPDGMLRDSEARYRWLFESTAIDGLIILHAKTGQVVDVNPFLSKLLGFSREQVIKKKIWELGYFKDILANKKNFKDLLQKGSIRYDGLPLKTADGRQIDVEFVGHVYEAGNQKMIQCSIRDITERKRTEEKLRETTDYLEKLITFANVPIVVWDSQFRITRFNHAFESLLGRTAGEVLCQTLESLFPPARQQFEMEKILGTLESEQLRSVEVEIQPIDGPIRTLLWSTASIFDKDGKTPIAAIAQGIDITERKRAEEVIRASEARYRQLVENANEAIVVVQDGLLKFVNRTTIEMMGYSEEELISRPFPGFIHPDDREMVVENYRRRTGGETVPSRYVFRSLARDGGVKWVEIGAVLIDWEGRPATLNFLTDITDRRKADESIQVSLREKEVMLQEIHHRVNNNMQVISSLFRLQAGKTANPEYREILKEGQTRIRAMSLVHEKLYRSSDLSKISLGDYIQSLASHLFYVFLSDPDRIRLETDFEEVSLDINSAVPCGLILNELISNSLKHAFPEGRKGMIRIGVRPGPDDTIIIRVADDGIGFPKNLDFRQSENLGLQIANLLVGQLEGTIELNRENGTAFTVTFRKLKHEPQI